MRDLGPHLAMILRNHGLLTCGRTIAEAFVLMYQLEFACRTQLTALATGQKLTLPSPELCEKTARQYAATAASRRARTSGRTGSA